MGERRPLDRTDRASHWDEVALAASLYVLAAVAGWSLAAVAGSGLGYLGLPAGVGLAWTLTRGPLALPGLLLGAVTVAAWLALGDDGGAPLAALAFGAVEAGVAALGVLALHALGGLGQAYTGAPRTFLWGVVAVALLPALRLALLDVVPSWAGRSAADGARAWLLVAGGALLAPAPALVRRLRARAAARPEGDLRRSEMVEAMVDNLELLVCQYRANTALVYVNRGMEVFFGESRDRLLQRRLFELVEESQWRALHQQLVDLSPMHPVARIELRARRADGVLRTLTFSQEGVFDDAGALDSVHAVGFDVTDLRGPAGEVESLAYADPLTGLPNRRLLDDRLVQALHRFHREGERFALLLLDLDHFKEVNDAMGHAAGDALLVAAAERLGAVLRQTDTLARLGGDEFVVLQADCSGEGDAATLARKIVEVITSPFEIEERAVQVSASIGVALAKPGVDGQELMAQADRALYAVKEGGRGFFAFDTSEIGEAALAQVQLAESLDRAVERDELFLLWQPEIDLDTGRIRALEALVRWRRADGEVLAPAAFVHVAERYGLMQRLGMWVLEHAVQQFHHWRVSGLAVPRIAVNVSVLQLREERFADRVIAMLARLEIPARVLELDLTESVLRSDDRVVERSLERLAEAGVAMAVDDFGVGYSSFAHVRRFPCTRLKIAEALAGDDPGSQAVVKASLTLANELGMDAVVEGIEQRVELERIRNLGARYGQGFLFSRPLPAGAVADLVHRNVTHASPCVVAEDK